MNSEKMTDQRLIIVSNRLPFKITDKKGDLSFSPSTGGLVSSIKSYIQKNSAPISKNKTCPLWIGTSDISEKKINQHLANDKLFYDDFELAPLFLSASLNDKFYNGFCNGTIWPLFHYFPSYAKFSDDTYESYVQANVLFCEKILAVYRPGDIIWIHDYHLMLLPALLRKHLPNATISFFLHIPFPSFELFRLIPSKWRKEILTGLLGSDLIGFHTNDYVQHFLKSIHEILGYENTLHTINTPDRSITVDAFPISIDYNKFNIASNDNDTFTERNRIKKRFYETKLITSVDRLDYAKGIANRLKSYELFLNNHPEYYKKVTYILVVVPSRDIITKYMETKKEIESIVSWINGKYGNIDWTPVVYQYKMLEFKKLLALYLAADVALITPMRDGMNLVAKEFVASRTDKRGVLILSETAGAAMELGEAILVNPTDRLEISHAIVQALSMSVEEQMTRNEIMQKGLQDYDVMRWAEDFLSQLRYRKLKQEKLKVKEMSPIIEQHISKKYSLAKTRLLLFDYDGTLSPIARLPQLASPSPEVISFLMTLAKDKKNEVVIISGRPIETLEKWFENIPINLVAEHGAFYRKKSADWLQTIPVNASWKSEVEQIMRLFAQRCHGTFIEEKTLSLAWHYRNAEKELGFMRSRELINSLEELSAHLDFQIIEGDKVIETRARGVDKGLAANIWIEQTKYDFIIAIGDDRTDEDMFKAIPETQFSIKVGLAQSDAKYNLKLQRDVLPLLQKILENKTNEVNSNSFI